MRQTLLLHPDFRCAAVESIGVEATRSPPAALSVRYFVTGDIRGLFLPSSSGPGRADELWRHTCFELFLRAGAQDAYYEFNFAPSLRWGAYRFDNYRQGMRVLEVPAPRMDTRQDARTFEFRCALDLDGLPDPDAGTNWQLGLTTIIEEACGGLSYWALAHPQGKPDFHHKVSFALALAAR